MNQSIRVRLTVLYAVAFFVAGAVLIGVNYLLVAQSFGARAERFEASVPDPEEFVLPAPPVGVAGGRTIVHGAPVDALGRTPDQVIRVYVDELRTETLRDLVVHSLWGLAGVGVIATVGGWGLASRTLRPIAAITDTARRLSGENLSERIALEGPDDELKELADTFDAMLDRLDDAFESQRRFVANASHELRTPLAVMRAEAEVALADPDATPEQLRAMAETVRTATERTDRLVDGLLTLARSDRGLNETEPVALDDVAASVVTQLNRRATGAYLRLDHDLQPVTVEGDGPLLDRLVGNLVDNAIAYNRAGGWVRVVTRPTADGHAVVEVVNTGPTIAADNVPGLFEPFRRLAGRTSANGNGVGLGLSIVRSIAHAHGGSAAAVARADGGLHVTVTLPGTLPSA